MYVAVLAGVVGMLSLTTPKSSALVGVLISVTTIPAAANIGVAAAYDDWDDVRGAALQLGVNLAGIFIAGFGDPLPAAAALREAPPRAPQRREPQDRGPAGRRAAAGTGSSRLEEVDPR